MNRQVSVLGQVQAQEDVTAVVKAMVMPANATDAELQTYLAWCRGRQLDPVTQGFVIRQGGKLVPGSTIAGLRAVAARTGRYGPQDGPYWLDEAGQWLDVWTDVNPPVAARVGVKQVDWDDYTYGVATWREFGAAKAQQQYSPWKTQPANMLAIRAEANALRRAFPADLAGMYTKEELREDEEITIPTPAITGNVRDIVGAEVWDQETGEHLGTVIDAREDPTPIGKAVGKKVRPAQVQQLSRLLAEADLTDAEKRKQFLSSWAGTADYNKMTENGADKAIKELERSLYDQSEGTDAVEWEGNELSEADWEVIDAATTS